MNLTKLQLLDGQLKPNSNLGSFVTAFPFLISIYISFTKPRSRRLTKKPQASSVLGVPFPLPRSCNIDISTLFGSFDRSSSRSILLPQYSATPPHSILLSLRAPTTFCSGSAVSFLTASHPQQASRRIDMAPPTGPRAGTNASAARGKSSSSRRPGGGIQKQRGPGGRTDRDGDVSMDAPTVGGGGSGAQRGRKSHGRSSNRLSDRTAKNILTYAKGGASNPSKARFAHTAILKVTGLDISEDKHLNSILSFLERKASKDQTKQVTINKVCWTI